MPPKSGDRAVRLTAPVHHPQFDPNEWHTIEEAAALLKVSPRRMRRWIYNGTVGYQVLPSGRGRRISGAHLNAAMASAPGDPE
jgi:excisionase family DNA binding protein